MFDPIKGPSNNYQGPATGLGTEAGDTWHDAVTKINAGFERVVDAIAGGKEAVDTAAREDIANMADTVAGLVKRADDQAATIEGLLVTVDKLLAASKTPTPAPAPTPAQ